MILKWSANMQSVSHSGKVLKTLSYACNIQTKTNMLKQRYNISTKTITLFY